MMPKSPVLEDVDDAASSEEREPIFADANDESLTDGPSLERRARRQDHIQRLVLIHSDVGDASIVEHSDEAHGRSDGDARRAGKAELPLGENAKRGDEEVRASVDTKLIDRKGEGTRAGEQDRTVVDAYPKAIVLSEWNPRKLKIGCIGGINRFGLTEKNTRSLEPERET